MNKKIPLYCDDCHVEIFVDVNMVIIKDELWNQICDKKKDAYCDHCMENRLGRPITQKDFKVWPDLDPPLCNLAWEWRQQRKLKTILYFG